MSDNLPVFWVQPEGNCCCSVNPCCEDCEEGQTALYGDLSCGCEKTLLTEMNSLEAGPAPAIDYDCDLANLPDCESDKCAVAEMYDIHKGDTYVIEFDTSSVSKFNHSNHWYEIIFEKCESEKFDWAAVFDPFIQGLADQEEYAVIAISYDDEIVYENYASNSAFDPTLRIENLVDLEGEQPKVNVASNTKIMTGAAIALLYDTGKLSAADLLVDVLKKYFYDGSGNELFTDRRYKQITIGMVASHMGGWDTNLNLYDNHRHAFELVKLFPSDYPNGIQLPLSDEDLLKWLINRPLDYSPGAETRYSNAGYWLLSKVIEEVGGTTYEKFIQENFLEPLGVEGHFGFGSDQRKHSETFMIENKYVLPNAQRNRGQYASAFAGTYRYDPTTNLFNGVVPWEVADAAWPALGYVSDVVAVDAHHGQTITRGGEGGFICTAGDYLKWLGLWLDNPSKNAILSKGAKDFMDAQAIAANRYNARYGQEISVATPNSPAYAYHGGAAHDYASQFVRYFDPRGVSDDAKCAGFINVFICVQGGGAYDLEIHKMEYINDEITPRVQSVLSDCKGPTCEPAFDVGDEIALNGECDPDGGGDPDDPDWIGDPIDPNLRYHCSTALSADWLITGEGSMGTRECVQIQKGDCDLYGMTCYDTKALCLAECGGGDGGDGEWWTCDGSRVAPEFGGVVVDECVKCVEPGGFPTGQPECRMTAPLWNSKQECEDGDQPALNPPIDGVVETCGLVEPSRGCVLCLEDGNVPTNIGYAEDCQPYCGKNEPAGDPNFNSTCGTYWGADCSQWPCRDNPAVQRGDWGCFGCFTMPYWNYVWHEVDGGGTIELNNRYTEEAKRYMLDQCKVMWPRTTAIANGQINSSTFGSVSDCCTNSSWWAEPPNGPYNLPSL